MLYKLCNKISLTIAITQGEGSNTGCYFTLASDCKAHWKKKHFNLSVLNIHESHSLLMIQFINTFIVIDLKNQTYLTYVSSNVLAQKTCKN